MHWLRRLGFLTICLIAFALPGLVWLLVRSDLPALHDAKGNVIANSLSEGIYVDLNGRKEWVVIRGTSDKNPVVVYLHGGPGFTDFGYFEEQASLLEQNAILAVWHQPCSGRSYHFFQSCGDVSHDMMLDDLDALVNYLRDRFLTNKVYLIGHSWGSVLAMLYAKRHPEKLSAVITISQVTSFTDMTAWNYEFALSEAEKRNNTAALAELAKAGPPNYAYGSDGLYDIWDAIPWLTVHRSWVGEFRGQPKIPELEPTERVNSTGVTHISYLDLFRSRLGARRVNKMIGAEVLEIDLMERVPVVDVPAYFFLGRLDPVCPPELSAQYSEHLTASRKQLVWFELSAHSLHWGVERPKYLREVVEVIHETEDLHQ